MSDSRYAIFLACVEHSTVFVRPEKGCTGKNAQAVQAHAASSGHRSHRTAPEDSDKDTGRQESCEQLPTAPAAQ